MVAQHTPTAVIVIPPSLVIVPPLIAVVAVTAEYVWVVSTGADVVVVKLTCGE